MGDGDLNRENNEAEFLERDDRLREREEEGEGCCELKTERERVCVCISRSVSDR